MARIDITNLDTPGWVPDMPPQQLPMGGFSSCKNVRFVDGSVERVKGYFEGYGTPQGTPREIIQARDADDEYVWVYAHDTGVALAKGEIHSNIGKTGSVYELEYMEKPSLLRFNDRVIVNYPNLPPQYQWPISPTDKLDDLPYFPAGVRAKRIVAFREFLLCLGVHNGTDWEHSTVLWSHSAEPNQLPDSWDISDPAKDAGAYQLGESADRLVDAEVLGNRLYIYKENSVYSVEYVGYPAIFSFKPIFKNRGILAPGCVVAFGNKHLVVDRGDIYVHNGSTEESILAGGWRRWWRLVVDRENGWRTFAKHYPYQREIWIAFPSDGKTDCDMVLVWNYENNTKALRTFNKITAIGSGYLDITDNIHWDAFTGMWVTNTDNWDTTVAHWNSMDNPEQWHEFASSWDSIIGNKNVNHFLLAVGSNNDPLVNKLAFADSTGRFGSFDFIASVERLSINYGSVDRIGRPIANLHSMKCLKEVWIRAESDGAIMVQVGTQEDINAPVSWEPPVAFQPNLHRKVDVFVSGKLLCIRFFSSQKGYWRIAGYELEIEEMGVY